MVGVKGKNKERQLIKDEVSRIRTVNTDTQCGSVSTCFASKQKKIETVLANEKMI